MLFAVVVSPGSLSGNGALLDCTTGHLFFHVLLTASSNATSTISCLEIMLCTQPTANLI